MSVFPLTRLRPSAAGSLIAAGVLWGTGGLAGSMLAAHGPLHPLSVATYRLLLGGLFSVVFLLSTGALRVPSSTAVTRRLAAAGALLAGAGFATLTLVTQRQVDGLDSVHTAAFGCLVGGVLLLPVALNFGVAMPVHAETVAIAIYLGAVPTALAYVAYFRGLRAAHPVLAALSALLEPVTAALLAAVLLDDRLGLLGWCGAALLVSAVVVSHLRPDFAR